MDTLYVVVSWLATYAIHSTVLLCTAWCLTRYFLADNPAARDVIWKTATVGALLTATVVMFALPGPATLLSERVLPGNWFGSEARGSQTVLHAYSAEATAESAFVVSSRSTEAPLLTQTAVPVVASGAPASTAGGTHVQLGGDVAILIVLAWLLVGVGLMIRLERRRARFLEKIGRRRGVLEGTMHNQLVSLSNVCDVDNLELTTANGISSPAVLTAREICVPREAFTELDDEEQRSLITHEFAHVIRRDPHWLRALHVIERVFFFQPLNRMARTEFEQAAEELCDNWVVDRTGEADSLASCLVRVARWVRGESDLGFASIAGQPLRKRIERLISGHETSGGRGHVAAVGSVLILVLAIAAWGPVLSVDELPVGEMPPGAAGLTAMRVDVPQILPPPPPPVVARPEAPPNPPLLGVYPPTFSTFVVRTTPPDTLVINFGRTENYEFADDGDMLRVTGFGTITLRESGSISGISSGGFFAIESETGRRTRKATARPSSPGAIAYEYTEGGQARSFDADAQEWFTEATAYFVDRMLDLEPRIAILSQRQRELEVVERQLARERAEMLATVEETRKALSSADVDAVTLTRKHIDELRLQSDVAMVESRIAAQQAAEVMQSVREEEAAIASTVEQARIRLQDEAVASQAMIQSAVEEARAVVQSRAALTDEAMRDVLTTTRQEYEDRLVESRRLIEELQVRIRELEERLKEHEDR